MGMLVRKGGQDRVALSAHNLLGRSSACTLRLDTPRASAEHARIAYRDGAWTVRDLGSRNGTFVNDERLDPGGVRMLRAGDEIAFGDPAATWTLADASQPVPMARKLRTDSVIAGQPGLLPLPSPDDPRCCIVEDTSGAWHVESEGLTRQATDGEILDILGEPFMLHLPVPVAATVEPEQVLRVSDVDLAFRVSRDEEVVELSVITPKAQRVLLPRSHHYMLLTLARVRVKSRDEGRLEPLQRGWVFVDDLCRMLSTDENKLNVEIFRVRQEMGQLGLTNGAAIVERRRGSRQLRVGTERISIAWMDALEPQ